MDNIRPELQANIDREVMIKQCNEKVKADVLERRFKARQNVEEFKHLQELADLEKDWIDG